MMPYKVQLTGEYVVNPDSRSVVYVENYPHLGEYENPFRPKIYLNTPYRMLSWNDWGIGDTTIELPHILALPYRNLILQELAKRLNTVDDPDDAQEIARSAVDELLHRWGTLAAIR